MHVDEENSESSNERFDKVKLRAYTIAVCGLGAFLSQILEPVVGDDLFFWDTGM